MTVNYGPSLVVLQLSVQSDHSLPELQQYLVQSWTILYILDELIE